jgi:thiosulfate/3-mercaptopyruvate sulfurtransferase
MKKPMTLLARNLAILLFALAAGAAPPQSAQAPAHPEMLVSTAWLAEHLKDSDLVILHVTDKRADYDRGHIPGAHFLQTSRFVDEHVGAMSELPPVEQLKKVFEEAGVGDNSRVVIYTTAWFPMAARAYYTLDFLGHEKIALLDGSMDQWLYEHRPVSSDAPKYSPVTFTPRLKPQVRALLDQVKKAVETADGNTTLVDSRPARRYKAGHLSGASPIYWQDTLVSDDSPVFRPIAELRQIFGQAGIKSGAKVITYCEVGLQASHGYFLAKYLGYDAAMYDGSYYEWSEMEHLPVVKGDAKR